MGIGFWVLSWGGAEEADVGVARRDVGIPRVEDERDAEGFPRAAGEVRTMGGGGRGKRRTADVREGNAGFFEHGALAEKAGAAAAAFRALPEIFAEFSGAVGLFERGANRVLEGEEVGTNSGNVGCGRHANNQENADFRREPERFWMGKGGVLTTLLEFALDSGRASLA